MFFCLIASVIAAVKLEIIKSLFLGSNAFRFLNRGVLPDKINFPNAPVRSGRSAESAH